MGIAHIPFIRFYQLIAVGIFGPVARTADWYGWFGFGWHYLIGGGTIYT